MKVIDLLITYVPNDYGHSFWRYFVDDMEVSFWKGKWINCEGDNEILNREVNDWTITAFAEAGFKEAKTKLYITTKGVL